MNNLGEIINTLSDLGYPDAYRIAKEILLFSKKRHRSIDRILKKLSTGIPWEYIQGYTTFCDIEVKVTPDVLIPRIETEEIINLFRQVHSYSKLTAVVDVGTGSGAIGIKIKKDFPSLSVICSDISTKALEIAKQNAKKNKVEIKFVRSNLLNNIHTKKGTYILANLPYIPSERYKKLDNSVKDFEPKLALDGGVDGLKYIERLINQMKSDINIEGAILEIDPDLENTLNRSIFEIEHAFINDSFGLVRFLKLYFQR